MWRYALRPIQRFDNQRGSIPILLNFSKPLVFVNRDGGRSSFATGVSRLQNTDSNVVNSNFDGVSAVRPGFSFDHNNLKPGSGPSGSTMRGIAETTTPPRKGGFSHSTIGNSAIMSNRAQFAYNGDLRALVEKFNHPNTVHTWKPQEFTVFLNTMLSAGSSSLVREAVRKAKELNVCNDEVYMTAVKVYYSLNQVRDGDYLLQQASAAGISPTNAILQLRFQKNTEHKNVVEAQKTLQMMKKYGYFGPEADAIRAEFISLLLSSNLYKEAEECLKEFIQGRGGGLDQSNLFKILEFAYSLTDPKSFRCGSIIAKELIETKKADVKSVYLDNSGLITLIDCLLTQKDPFTAQLLMKTFGEERIICSEAFGNFVMDLIKNLNSEEAAYWIEVMALAGIWIPPEMDFDQIKNANPLANMSIYKNLDFYRLELFNIQLSDSTSEKSEGVFEESEPEGLPSLHEMRLKNSLESLLKKRSYGVKLTIEDVKNCIKEISNCEEKSLCKYYLRILILMIKDLQIMYDKNTFEKLFKAAIKNGENLQSLKELIRLLGEPKVKQLVHPNTWNEYLALQERLEDVPRPNLSKIEYIHSRASLMRIIVPK